MGAIPKVMIAYERRGAGEPLLLIHGTGLDRHCWTPLVPQLQRQFGLLMIDLPGHGASPGPPSGVEHSPRGYAPLLAAWLDELGLERVHVAGNSVGGWTAFELGKIGRARSITALAPAGLWPGHDPFSAKAQLWLNHHLSRLFSPIVPFVLRRPLGRKLFLSGAIGDPANVPPEDAIALSRTMGSTPGFADHLRDTTRARFEGGQNISVPVTVAWGSREKIVPVRARRRDELPESARLVELPGCGHLPFWDAPDLTAQTIIATAKAAANAATRSAHESEQGR